MAHEHDLKCGSCGNELRSPSQSHCSHCGVAEPLQAKPNTGHADTAGDRELPRTIGGLTIEQVLEMLETRAARDKRTTNDFGFKPAA